MLKETNIVIICNEDNVLCEDEILDKLFKDKDFNSTFYNLIRNKVTMLGRKCWNENFNRELFGKICIIMSKTQNHKKIFNGYRETTPIVGGATMLLYADSFEKAFAYARRLTINNGDEEKDAFILGGYSVLEQTIDSADNIFMFQFYSTNNKNRVLNLNDNKWYANVLGIFDNFDFIKLIKRNKLLDEFGDPTEN